MGMDETARPRPEDFISLEVLHRIDEAGLDISDPVTVLTWMRAEMAREYLDEIRSRMGSDLSERMAAEACIRTVIHGSESLPVALEVATPKGLLSALRLDLSDGPVFDLSEGLRVLGRFLAAGRLDLARTLLDQAPDIRRHNQFHLAFFSTQERNAREIFVRTYLDAPLPPDTLVSNICQLVIPQMRGHWLEAALRVQRPEIDMALVALSERGMAHGVHETVVQQARGRLALRASPPPPAFTMSAP